jgi:hypothetical protein
MRAHHRGVEHLHERRGAAHPRERLEERLEHARLAQAPKALPDRVPVAELGRQRPPGDVVEREVVKSFQELAVVAALGAAPRAAGPEHLQHSRPVLVRHPCQHGQSFSNRPAMNHRCADLGIHSATTHPNPSTPPRSTLIKGSRFQNWRARHPATRKMHVAGPMRWSDLIVGVRAEPTAGGLFRSSAG